MAKTKNTHKNQTEIDSLFITKVKRFKLWSDIHKYFILIQLTLAGYNNIINFYILESL